MADFRIENLNIESEDPIVTPRELKEQFPLSDIAAETVAVGQETVKRILAGVDPRLFVVVGPCSIHDVRAAKEYAAKLKVLSAEVEESLFLLMRVYFEKPRTTVGWQGFLTDPGLDNTCDIDQGVKLARELLLHVAEAGLPVATEALDLVTPQYIQDLISWTAIGARTTEAQTHRKMASGLSSVVGFKNGTAGNLDVAVNAMKSAAVGHNFVSVDPNGSVAVIRTKGNKETHMVLRGGDNGSNFDVGSIGECEKALVEAGLASKIMVDCSHANSQKIPENQAIVVDDVIRQIADGNQSIIALMLESHLNAGTQKIPQDTKNLQYGVSITDACIDWGTTESLIRRLHNKLKEVLPKRR